MGEHFLSIRNVFFRWKSRSSPEKVKKFKIIMVSDGVVFFIQKRKRVIQVIRREHLGNHVYPWERREYFGLKGDES